MDGVVVGAAATGDLLAPGATRVSIQPDACAHPVWLSPGEFGQVCLDDRASCTATGCLPAPYPPP